MSTLSHMIFKGTGMCICPLAVRLREGGDAAAGRTRRRCERTARRGGASWRRRGDGGGDGGVWCSAATSYLRRWACADVTRRTWIHCAIALRRGASTTAAAAIRRSSCVRRHASHRCIRAAGGDRAKSGVMRPCISSALPLLCDRTDVRTLPLFRLSLLLFCCARSPSVVA